jgi:hypothetical protein
LNSSPLSYPDAFFSTLGVFETRRLVDGGED